MQQCNSPRIDDVQRSLLDPTILTLVNFECQDARGGSRKGSKGNAVRALVHNAAAAPATVSGEPPTSLPLGTCLFPGRSSEVLTREPGDLPPQESRAGTAGGVS